jgi:hypothetical protein
MQLRNQESEASEKDTSAASVYTSVPCWMHTNTAKNLSRV